MNLLGLFLSTTLMSWCTGDLVISDVKNNKHMIVNEDLKLITIFEFKFNGRSRKVRKTENGLVVYDLEDGEIRLHNVSKDGIVSEIGTISISQNDTIDAFDVQPSGDLVVMSSGNKIYLFSQKDNNSTEILQIDSRADVIFIHPTEKKIYYAKCPIDSDSSLFVHNIETKEQEQQHVPSCSFHIDFQENAILDTSDSRITKINMKTKTTEVITSIPKDSYSASALSSYHLFFMRLKRKGEIYKLATSTKLNKIAKLKEYAVEPVLATGNFVPAMLNGEKDLIEVFKSNYEEYFGKIEIEVEAKSILTLKTFSDASSCNFFWIYASNAGTVEYAKVDIVAERLEKRGSFHVTTEGADIVDFDADTKVFYFATQRKIFKIRIENLEPTQDFDSIESPFAEPIKAIGILLGELIVSHCNDSKSGGLATLEIHRDFRLANTFDSAPRCSERILVNGHTRKIIVSSSTGLYNLDLDDEAEKIYNLTDIKNFVLNGVFVYFVSKIDGPGIYKVYRWRIVKIDHELPFAEDGKFEILKVKDNNADDPKGTTKTPDDQSNDETTQAYQKNIAKNSSSSEVMPPGRMILLLLILVANCAPKHSS